MRKMKDPQQKLEKLKQLQPQFLVTNVEPEELQKETFKKKVPITLECIITSFLYASIAREYPDTSKPTNQPIPLQDASKKVHPSKCSQCI